MNRLKTLISELKSQKGFTLVELLVVIVVIGILATALLAAINPLEQIRRAQDSSNIAAARELVEACERSGVSSEGSPTMDVATLIEDGELKGGWTLPAAVTVVGACSATVAVTSIKYIDIESPYSVP